VIFDMVRFLKKLPIIHLMAVLTLALLCQGCGKTGDPMPPDVAMSKRVADLAVRPEKGIGRFHVHGSRFKGSRVYGSTVGSDENRTF